MRTSARTGSTERPVPFTYNRASTELVQSRHHLGMARDSLEVVLAILDRLDPEPGGFPVAALGEILGRLEEAQAALQQITERAVGSWA